MPKILRYLILAVIGVFSFVIFLYWMFPYDVVKDKIEAAVEQQFEGVYDLKIEKLSPSFITGIVLKKVSLNKRNNAQLIPVLEAEKVKMRISLSSLLFGGNRVAFQVRGKQGKVKGYFKEMSEGVNIFLNFSDYDLKGAPFLRYQHGLDIAGEINGKVDLSLNLKRATSSKGSVNLELDKLKVMPSKLRFGTDEGAFIELPELDLSKNEKSNIKLNIENGTLQIEQFALGKGDMALNLEGKIYLATFFKNYRMNVEGTMRFDEKVEKALPFLFIVEKQKNEKGEYPIHVTGRIASPTIKVGTFTLPL